MDILGMVGGLLGGGGGGGSSAGGNDTIVNSQQIGQPNLNLGNLLNFAGGDPVNGGVGAYMPSNLVSNYNNNGAMYAPPPASILGSFNPMILVVGLAVFAGMLLLKR